MQLTQDNAAAQLFYLLALMSIPTGAYITDQDGRHLADVSLVGSAGINKRLVLTFEEVTS